MKQSSNSIMSESFDTLLNKKEDLNPDLKPYLCNTGNFPMLRHPLVYSVPYSPMMNALINKQYTGKKKKVAEYLIDENYNSYIFFHERPYRFSAFLEIAFKIKDDKEYWELAQAIWVDSENIWQNKQGWLIIFQSHIETKEYFMSEGDKKTFNALPDKITIYRGYQKGKNKKGLSYTLDKEKAAWFAKRFHKDGLMLEKEVRKEDVFAYTNERGENEIIYLK